MDLTYEEFGDLENVHKIGTYIRSFKELLRVDTNRDEYFYLSQASTFVIKV